MMGDFLIHYNHNHDPNNGRFTFGSGGRSSGVKLSKKEVAKAMFLSQDPVATMRQVKKAKKQSPYSQAVDNFLNADDKLEKAIQKESKKFKREGSTDPIGEATEYVYNAPKYKQLLKERSDWAWKAVQMENELGRANTFDIYEPPKKYNRR